MILQAQVLESIQPDTVHVKDIFHSRDSRKLLHLLEEGIWL
jgi:hypothetical protein